MKLAITHPYHLPLHCNYLKSLLGIETGISGFVLEVGEIAIT
ncbi:hypothetical protein GXM_02379 [Nostoc sphaeroides CCNUC1]|uniref:Uncharacterized protein n=1 Tax=Nostoc sphaeroides CCNUC1 TaxID=2653204 RepID=A0A5P8VX11_9NOSO|nr:hypothetical protein GXM_02379 [Nostoc sphaeroides CCNUC1]